LAVSRRFISNGQEQEETCFVDVVVWGKAAANCRQYLSKGSQVMIEGRLQLDSWEDRNGGGRRTKLRVVAENIQFMNRRRDDAGAPNGAAPNNYQNSGYQNNNYQNNGYQNNYQSSGYQQPNAGAYRPSEMPPMPDP
jgi:single-strand DNA-binding protein